MELRDAIEPLRRGIGIVLVATVVGLVASLLVASQLPVAYEARASLIAQNTASTYAEVARSRPLLAGVISSLGLDVTPDALADRVQARPSQTSALLTISVRDGDAARAAAIANGIAEALVEQAPEISGSSEDTLAAIREDLAAVQKEIERTQAIIDDLSSRPDPTPAEAAELEAQHAQLAELIGLRTSLQGAAITYAQSVVTMLDPAVTPTRAASPSLPLAGIVGALVGLIIGLGLVLVPVYLNRRSMPQESPIPSVRWP